MNDCYPPQNGGYDYYAQMRMQQLQNKKKEKHELRIYGTLTGAAILCVLLLQEIVALLLKIFNLYDAYLTNSVFQMGADILITVVSILLPFFVFGKIMQKRNPSCDIAPLEKSKDSTLALLSVPTALGACMLANIVTGYLTAFLTSMGLELSSQEIGSPKGVSGFILSTLRVCVIAAIAEEISFRGCAMQPIRKYGDGFAIVMSACAFGLMHGNLIQAPFALIVGLCLGYITVKTGSLWPAIVVHALNNFVSNTFAYLLDYSSMGQTVVGLIYNFVVYLLLIAGIVAGIFFLKRAKLVAPSVRSQSCLSTGEKTWAYIFNPTMIVAVGVMLYVTSQFVRLA